MKGPRTVRSSTVRLPLRLRPLFWDQDFSRLTWEADGDPIVGRVLAAGDWEAVQWLRQRLSRSDLADWLTRRQGAGLSGPQLRFWELILGLPQKLVSAWLAQPRRQVWERRRHA